MEKFYESQENVMIRVSLGDIEAYEFFLENDIDNRFQEAVLVASESLYDAYQRKSQKKDAVKRSILKYRIRNATRCTPYGLFAGVGMITVSDSTNLKLSNSGIEKRARIDMKWLFQYIALLLQNEEIIPNLRIRFNDSCYVIGDRMVNPYFSANGIQEDMKSSSYSIRHNRASEFVKKSSQKFIGYRELIEKVSLAFNVKVENIKKYIDELIKYGFLIVEIVPPLINTDAVNYVIQILDNGLGDNTYSYFLKKICQKISDYNRTSIGEGIFLYKNIVNDMKKVLESKQYLQVDTKIVLTDQTISRNVQQEVEKVFNFLTQLAAGYHEQEYIIHYKEDFLEKYGYNTEVLLLEMLDDNLGIGIPANYKNSQRKFIDYSINNDLLEVINGIIINKAITALKNNKSVIYLTDEDINILDNRKIKHENLLNSVDFVVQILAKSVEDIDRGDYRLLLSGCISSAGALNSAGRFSDMFWKDKNFDYTSIEYEQDLIGKDCIVAELVEICKTGRTANVEMNMNSIPYQICIGCNSCKDKYNISINDIYIGVDKITNQFYAKSKKMNKRIYAKTTHMLNNFFGSPAYRFLRDISTLATKYQYGEIVTSLGNPNWTYFPRIMYGKTIIRPQKWIYVNSKEKDFCEWDKKFENWLIENKVPDYVDYAISDHYLRLDLRKVEYRELLYYDSINEEIILLKEDFISEESLWVKDEQGKKHCCEMVFSFNKKKNVDANLLNIEKLPSEKPYYFNESDRLLFPGENGWYYFKLYGMKGREDEFIGVELRKIVSQLSANNIIDKHFFIRYSDKNYHTRVRFHVCKDRDNDFNVLLKKWILEEKAKGIITDLSLTVYERETERYGGNVLIPIAEEVFWKDSLFVEKMKEKCYFREIHISNEEIAIWSIWGILQSFDLNMEEAEKWLSKTILKNDYRDIYKRNEKAYKQSLKLSLGFDSDIKDLYDNRNATVRKFYCAIIKSKEENSLTNTIDEILSTLIHMFCNRYAGNNSWERKVRALTRHALHSEISYKRFGQNIK